MFCGRAACPCPLPIEPSPFPLGVCTVQLDGRVEVDNDCYGASTDRIRRPLDVSGTIITPASSAILRRWSAGSDMEAHLSISIELMPGRGKQDPRLKSSGRLIPVLGSSGHRNQRSRRRRFHSDFDFSANSTNARHFAAMPILAE